MCQYTYVHEHGASSAKHVCKKETDVRWHDVWHLICNPWSLGVVILLRNIHKTTTEGYETQMILTVLILNFSTQFSLLRPESRKRIKKPWLSGCIKISGLGGPHIKRTGCLTYPWGVKKQIWYLLASSASKGPQSRSFHVTVSGIEQKKSLRQLMCCFRIGTS